MSAVTEYLERTGVPYEVLHHAVVRTAAGEAYALGIPPEAVVKTIVLDVGRGHVLAVLPAARRLDVRRVQRALRNHVHLATEDELRRHYPQYELGTFPPLGTLLLAPMLIDPEVVAQREVVFAAGTPDESVRVRTRDLLALEHAIATPIAVAPETAEDRVAAKEWVS